MLAVLSFLTALSFLPCVNKEVIMLTFEKKKNKKKSVFFVIIDLFRVIYTYGTLNLTKLNISSKEFPYVVKNNA